MPQIERASGIMIEFPDELTVSEPPHVRRRRGGMPEPGSVTGESSDDLADALASSGFEVVDSFDVEPAPMPPTRRRAPGEPGTSGPTAVNVEVSESESAVLLVEEDGYFSWHFPESDQPIAPSARRRRGGPPGPTRQLRFELDLGEPTLGAGPRRRRIPILGKAVEKVTTTVLRFALPPVIDRVVQHLEKDRLTRLVEVDSGDPALWDTASTTAFTATSGRRARVLLFIHGTFSSTRGGFGALGATPWGQTFLQTAKDRFDFVLGYDHRTLGLDPEENAVDLLERLKQLWPNGDVEFDVVCHSRGGLVYRCLLERCLPGDAWAGTFAHAVFVAAANSGTELANRDNWTRLVDLYTNLAAAAARGLAIIVPGAQAGALVLGEVLDGIGTLVKTIVTRSLVDEDIPGLAAMQPNGKFIADLNATGAGQPTAGTSNYYAITSNFEPALRDPDKELPARLKALLMDGLVDQLLAADNDMVVDVKSMTSIDPTGESLFDETFDYGSNGAVYHTNYFHQPQTSKAISHWLGLEEPVAPRRRGAPTSAMPLPVGVTGDIAVLEAGRQLESDLILSLHTTAPAYVVIDRAPYLRYAFSLAEAYGIIDDALENNLIGRPLAEVFDLHEGDASAQCDDGLPKAAASAGRRPTTGRTVMLAGDTPVGVVVAGQGGMTAVELAALVAEPVPIPRHRILMAGPRTANGGSQQPRPRMRSISHAEPPAHDPEPPPVAAAASTEPSAVSVNVGAWTDAELEVSQPATLTVALSREELSIPETATSGTGTAMADPEKPLIVMVIGRKNVRVTGKSTQTVAVPAAGADAAELYFDIVGTDLGPAQVDVVIRQAESPLAKIILKPSVVRSVTGGRRAEARLAAVPSADPGPPRHQLYISEEERGGQTTYRFHLELLRPGEPPEPIEAESPPLRGDKTDYVRDLYKRIEEMWGDNRDKIDQFAEQMRAEGGVLWDQLIPDAIKAELWNNREKIGFIQVYSDEPFIPWELVHMKEPGKRTLPADSWFLAELGLVRWMMPDGGTGCSRAPRTLRVRSGNVSAVIPEYPAQSGWKLDSAETELATLQATFGDVNRITADFSSVRAALSVPGLDLFHYAGHGMGQSDKIGDEALVLSVAPAGRVWQAGSVFRAADVASHAVLCDPPCADSRPIVVLNCCETGRQGYTLTSIGGLASAFLGAGAGVLVSPLWSVDDVAAAEFSKAFYGALKAGETLAASAQKARAAIKASGDQTWLAYTVYGEPTARIVES